MPLERLEESWGDRLQRLTAPTPAFAEHMQGRETEYEQLCVYLIYRHFANAPDLQQAGAVAVLTLLCYQLIYALGATQYGQTGEFTFEDQVELARLFSSELEYSEENMDILLDELC